MIKQFENRKLFQCALGQFVFEFAELEFSLLYFWGLIDTPKNQNASIRENIGTDFEDRRKKVTGFIHKNLPDLKTRWEKINPKLSSINLERRYLIHGIGQARFYEDSITAVIKHKGELKLKTFTVADIKKLSDKIAHLLTGKDGLAGEFLIDFTADRFNHYNKQTSDGKIIYKVNDKILTDYKG